MGEFRDGVAKAMIYAMALGVGQLNCLAGIAPPGVSGEALGKLVNLEIGQKTD